MFYLGSPGFDIHGNPKKQIVKCPKCGNFMCVTSKIKEITTVTWIVDYKKAVKVREGSNHERGNI